MKTININKVIKAINERLNSSIFQDKETSIYYKEGKYRAYQECIQIIKDNIKEIKVCKHEEKYREGNKIYCLRCNKMISEIVY